MSNSVDPDETAHDEPSHLGLYCLQKPIIIAYGSERVKNATAMLPCIIKNRRKYTMYERPVVTFQLH